MTDTTDGGGSMDLWEQELRRASEEANRKQAAREESLRQHLERFPPLPHADQWLRVATLAPASFAREIRWRRVEEIVENFDLNCLGQIKVWYHEGHYIIIDGQHRWRACQLTNHYWVKCRVYWDLTLEQAAGMFMGFDTTIDG